MDVLKLWKADLFWRLLRGGDDAGECCGFRYCGEGVLSASWEHGDRWRQRKEVLVLHAGHGAGKMSPPPSLPHKIKHLF